MRKRVCSSLSQHGLVTFAVDSGYPAHVAEAALQQLAKKLRTSNLQQITTNDHAAEYFNIIEQQQETGEQLVCVPTPQPVCMLQNIKQHM
jgi:hypothetical protein